MIGYGISAQTLNKYSEVMVYTCCHLLLYKKESIITIYSNKKRYYELAIRIIFVRKNTQKNNNKLNLNLSC